MSAYLNDATLLRIVFTTIAIVPFGLFASAGIWHFGGKQKSGTAVVSIASVVGFVAMLTALWSAEGFTFTVIPGLVLQLGSAFLFGWSVGTSGQRTLSLAYSPNCSPRLVTEGPYAVVRHPFYTSYILYWLGNALVAPTPYTIGSAATLVLIYLHASRGEDAFLTQRFGDEFVQWQRRTGAFFPKLARFDNTALESRQSR
ncbi:methyltransferase family protein [Novosphingobium piscinae]|uniref:Isoprenylcysteine carboxylmethyltransferase family protein n=1 Tax=Novosphingobium piscinae TaxID=1507448 RepID=A0A7X1FWI7_9SPHN|nr:isoprenylcysteine carboxylmethyltransferase family protein [Novosphingobium piscinae]MBC2668154.1 isoprenylcysteine carboxylmethyltransferase family protein [Novosphingobium piscinae]